MNMWVYSARKKDAGRAQRIFEIRTSQFGG